MPNFFTDNDDIVWHLHNMDLSEVIRLAENDFADAGQYPHAFEDEEDALDSYERTLTVVGDLAGNFVAPRATDVDRIGVKLEDGVVSYAPGTVEEIKAFSQADLMGFTLPRRYGGLNIPATVYSMAIDMVSRADAAFMTIFGLQDIAETINAFASEDQKQRYLPRFCTGEVTGAMVLTEPDAGSDLQAVRLRAHQDEDGVWRLNGVKRFITNGCGHVLLVLARSEEGTSDGRGLSMFLCDNGPDIVIQRVEDKLGIHGSPTCQMFFKNAPCELVGQRRRGLITYVMALMNGARLGIASQGVGLSEAAYRAALAYAVERRQFGKAIFDIPAVSEMLIDMKVGVETSRSLLYETARSVDMEQFVDRNLKALDRKDPAFKETRRQHVYWRKLANVLTPMAKYYCCNTCMDNTTTNIQIHGGSGFMRDYEAERYWRDARITTIYEGTTELQAVAILAGLHGGNLTPYLDEMDKRVYEGEVAELQKTVRETRGQLEAGLAHCRDRDDTDYTDLMGKRLSDLACDTVISYLLLEEAKASERKLIAARRFIGQATRRAAATVNEIEANDDAAIRDYRTLLQDDVPKE